MTKSATSNDERLDRIWKELAAPLDPEDIKVRTDRGVDIRYIDARTVYERLNSVVPHEWSMEVSLLFAPTKQGEKWVFKGRMTICGVVHEDVGMNDNEGHFDPPKAAVSDCVKRCAVHFGIGLELYRDAEIDAEYSKPKPTGKKSGGANKEAYRRPYSPEIIKRAIETQIAKSKLAGDATDAQKIKIIATFEDKIKEYDPEDCRHAVQLWAFGGKSLSVFTKAEASVLIEWTTNEHFEAEANSIASLYPVTENGRLNLVDYAEDVENMIQNDEPIMDDPRSEYEATGHGN